MRVDLAIYKKYSNVVNDVIQRMQDFGWIIRFKRTNTNGIAKVFNLNFKKLKKKKKNVILTFEKWSNKYKKSIDCKNPKGFSQIAHCAARKKRQRREKTKSKPVK